MIIENGTICAKIKMDGELINGNPIRPSETWDKPIPCNIKTNQCNNRGKVDGNTFKTVSYEVLINEQPFDAEMVKLVRHGKDLGEFTVQDIDRLPAVGAIKISV